MSLLPKRRAQEPQRLPAMTLKDEVDRLFDEFFNGPFLAPAQPGQWLPALDMSETATQVILRAELPGMEAKDVDVSITGDMLTIKGEKKEESKKEEQNFYRMERRYGSFQRSVALPSTVDAEKVNARFKNGVLTVTVDKKEEA